MERFVKGKHVLFLSMLKTEADNAISHDLAVIFACIFVCMILNLLLVCSFFVPLNALVSVSFENRLEAIYIYFIIFFDFA